MAMLHQVIESQLLRALLCIQLSLHLLPTLRGSLLALLQLTLNRDLRPIR